MRENSVFIFASTKDVYGSFADNFREVPETCPTLYNGQSALEWSKLIAERYVEYYAQQRNFRSCIFRLSTVYAPMSEGNTPNFVTHYADSINKGEPIRLAAGGAPRRDFLHVEDFARACQAFVDSVIRHGLYNLGGGAENALSLRELVAKMEEISGYQAINRRRKSNARACSDELRFGFNVWLSRNWIGNRKLVWTKDLKHCSFNIYHLIGLLPFNDK
ncbi:MAG: NAD-dependent epimerase/dehydratase family protein [Hymenobacter sp.]